MNCYLFRDQISAYIEKDLTLTQVKQFETHLSTCSECQDAYDGVLSVIQTLKNAGRAFASQAFEESLKARLEKLPDRPIRRSNRFLHGGTILGFQPRYAVMSAAALVAIIILSVSLFPGGGSQPLEGPVPLSTRQSLPNPSPGTVPGLSPSSGDAQMASDSGEDSTGEKGEDDGGRPDYDDRIRLVKDRK